MQVHGQPLTGMPGHRGNGWVVTIRCTTAASGRAALRGGEDRRTRAGGPAREGRQPAHDDGARRQRRVRHPVPGSRSSGSAVGTPADGDPRGSRRWSPGPREGHEWSSEGWRKRPAPQNPGDPRGPPGFCRCTPVLGPSRPHPDARVDRRHDPGPRHNGGPQRSGRARRIHGPNPGTLNANRPRCGTQHRPRSSRERRAGDAA